MAVLNWGATTTNYQIPACTDRLFGASPKQDSDKKSVANANMLANASATGNMSRNDMDPSGEQSRARGGDELHNMTNQTRVLACTVAHQTDFRVLKGPHAAARLASQLQSDIQLATLYSYPLRFLRGGSADVVAVAGLDDDFECALVPARPAGPEFHFLVVPVANPKVEALSSLAQAVFSMQGAPTKVVGFEPHIGEFAQLAPSPQPAPQRQMAWWHSRGRMHWSPDDPRAMAAASKVSLPAGATVGVPESRADFEAMARIHEQNYLGNDGTAASIASMEKRGLEERVKEMAEDAAEGNVTVAREPGGALVALVQLVDERDGTVYVKAVGTLPSHARRGYAAGLLAHALLTKMKRPNARATLMLVPGNEPAIACYTKLGFVHAGEYAGYKYADD